MINVAIYGGSFDPVHLGHVMVPTHLLLNDPSIDQVVVMVCHEQTGKKLKPFCHRYNMAKMAFEWLPKVVVSDYERWLGGESVTLHTLRALKKDHPDWNMRLVLGTDLLEQSKTWEGWEEIEGLALPLPVGRAGISPVLPGQATPISPLVSSTIVRNALLRKDYVEVERYLPRKVLEYIRLYEMYT